MKIEQFRQEPTTEQLNDRLSKVFGTSIDLDKFSTEQLQTTATKHYKKLSNNIKRSHCGAPFCFCGTFCTSPLLTYLQNITKIKLVSRTRSIENVSKATQTKQKIR